MSSRSSPELPAILSGAPVVRVGIPTPASAVPYVEGPPSTTRHRFGARALRRTLALSVAEGMIAEWIVACTGGALLTAWALHLGCSPLVIALLGALPFLSQVVQFPSAWLTSALGSRRVALVALAIARATPLPFVALPWLPFELQTKRLLLVLIAGASAAFSVIGANAWTAWMGNLVPDTLRGRYFGRRIGLVTLSGSFGALTAGLLLDFAKGHGAEDLALALLACLAVLAGTFTILLLRRKLPPKESIEGSFNPRGAWEAIRDPASRPFLRYQLAWNAAIGLASAFFAVFMLQHLQMGFALIALHGIGMAVVRALVSPLWGSAIDRFGARPVLVVCSFGLPLVPLTWLLPTAEHYAFPLLLDVLFAGALWAGHAIASFELPLAVAPRERRPYYVAAFSTAGGLAFAVASIAGGFLAEALPASLSIGGVRLANLQLLFLLTAVGRAAAAPLSLQLVDPRAAPREAIVATLKRHGNEAWATAMRIVQPARIARLLALTMLRR